jgi:asparagine synthase (glutamine-hydrolysing)
MLNLIRWNNYPFPRFAKKLGLPMLSALGKTTGLPYELLRRASLGVPLFWGGVDAFSQRAKLDILSPRLRLRFKNQSSWNAIRPFHERFMEKAWEKTPAKWMTYIDLNMRLPELLLMRLDKMGMGASLETRVPFLDHKFVQLAMSIPEQVITRGGVSKHILKKAVRNIIPDQIIDRKKQGFGVPILDWFRGPFGEFARRELLEFCDKTDFLDGVAVAKLIQSGRVWDAWFLLNFALWWKEFIGENSVSTRNHIQLQLDSLRSVV